MDSIASDEFATTSVVIWFQEPFVFTFVMIVISRLTDEIFPSQIDFRSDVEVPHQLAEGQSQLSWLGAVDVAIAGPRF